MPEYKVTFTKTYTVTETKTLVCKDSVEAQSVAQDMDNEDAFFENPDNLYYAGQTIQVEEV